MQTCSGRIKAWIAGAGEKGGTQNQLKYEVRVALGKPRKPKKPINHYFRFPVVAFECPKCNATFSCLAFACSTPESTNQALDRGNIPWIETSRMKYFAKP